jgi:uncharacterized protein YkwD
MSGSAPAPVISKGKIVLRRFHLTVGFILITLAASLWLLSPPTSQGMAHAAGELSSLDVAFELELVRLVNAVRVERGLTPLARSPILTAAARAHNQDMITNDFLSHSGSDGAWPAQRACAQGYVPYSWGACYVGENIGAGYPTAADVLMGWLNSPDHWVNLLWDKYREVGVGYSTGGRYGHYWTMDLGAQPYVLPVFVNEDADNADSCRVTLTLTKEGVSSYGSLGQITGVRAGESASLANVPWTPWAWRVPFTFSAGGGIRTVYVEYTDGDRNVLSSDSITLDLLPAPSVRPATVVILVEAATGRSVPAWPQIRISGDDCAALQWTAEVNQPWVMLGAEAGVAPAEVTVWLNSELVDLRTPGIRQASIAFHVTDGAGQNTSLVAPLEVHIVDVLYQHHFAAVFHDR